MGTSAMLCCLLVNVVLILVSFVDGSANRTGLESSTKSYLFYMNQNCHKTVRILGREAIRLIPWKGNHPFSHQRCPVGVESWGYQNFQLVLTFREMALADPAGSGFCTTNRLDLFEGNSTSRSQRMNGPEGLCGSSVPREEYTSKGNFATLLFSTGIIHPNQQGYFEAVVTPYHYGACDRNELRCGNGRCISDTLRCDGYDNCGDDSDEKNCAAIVLSIAAIVGIVLGCMFFVGIIIAIIICRCCCECCMASGYVGI